MRELERKFKLKYLPTNTAEPVIIKQAYLLLQGPKHLRVRIIDDKTAFMTYKEIVSSVEKKEYEFPIPISEANELYENATHKLIKKRYCSKFNDNQVDIDVYPNGLQVVEIEFEEELNEIPDYCGEEVTGKKEYSNIGFALSGEMKEF